MAVCFNCHILLRHNLQLHQYFVVDLGPELLSIAEEWGGREVSETDQLCQGCMNRVIVEATNRSELPQHRRNQHLGHVCVCICCGISLGERTGRRRHRLEEDSLQRNYIKSQIFPCQVPNDAWACHRCWMRAHWNVEHRPPLDIPEIPEVAVHEGSTPSTRTATVQHSESDLWTSRVPENQPPQPENTMLNLNDYSRTPDTTNHCFVPDCNNIERLRVPKYLRRSILKEYKVYITPRARVCQQHISLYNWDILNEYEFMNSFNASQIENMLHLLSSAPTCHVPNFEDIVNNMNDNLLQYWTGFNVAFYNSVPQKV